MRLALRLAAAMFVLVVDTSLMNVSISAVVADLGTTVSGVQSAIALEALVSAAFILISSKVGDLIGRKRAFTLGLLGYAIGALAMVLAQTLVPIIIFWAIFGGLGASLLLPSMQSLIHGNFEGAAQKRVYALVGASAAIAAAVGPLLGGFITTFLSWRVGFLLELVVIAVVLLGIGHDQGRAVHGHPAGSTTAGRSCRSSGWAASCSASWPGRKAPRASAYSSRSAPSRSRCSPTGSCGASGREGHAHRSRTCSGRRTSGSGSPGRRSSRSPSAASMIALADLPADGPRVQRAPGRPVARPAVAEHVLRRHPRRAAGRRPAAEHDHPRRLRPGQHRHAGADPDRAAGGLRAVAGDPAGRRRLRVRPARLAAQQLHARADLRGAHQRGGRGELGRRVVRPVVRPGAGRRPDAREPWPSRSPTWPSASTVLPPDEKATGRGGPRRETPRS